MHMCWRWPPMIALMAFVGHTTSWFGSASPASVSHLNPVAHLGGLLSGADSVINQVFAWMFVLIAFEVFCLMVGYAIGEYKLRRQYDRPSRIWARPVTPTAPHDFPR